MTSTQALHPLDAELLSFVRPDGDPFRRKEIINDPYPFFDRLRDHAPAYRCAVLDTTFITSYDLTRNLWRERGFSSVQPQRDSLTAAQRLWVENGFAFTDPPEHTRLRKVCAAVFTPRAVESQRPNAARISADLVREIMSKESFDFKSEFAYIVPQRVISDMLGIPAVERDNFTRWAADLSRALETSSAEPPDVGTATRSSDEMLAFFDDLIESKRRAPTDDLVSDLVALHDSGEMAMTERDVMSTAIMLYTGGFTTTANQISNLMWTLIRNPAVYRELAGDLSLFEVAVEEGIRYESPARNSIRRTATQELEFGGLTFQPGDVVYAIAGAANRDPLVFADPHTFSLHRPANERHVGFGGGIHVCIGSSLARLEVQEAVRCLMESGRMLELNAVEVEWEPTFVLRRLKELPVSWVS